MYLYELSAIMNPSERWKKRHEAFDVLLHPYKLWFIQHIPQNPLLAQLCAYIETAAWCSIEWHRGIVTVSIMFYTGI